ncbi:MAG: hypothetical protein P4L62_04890 [Candidatus Pacebacteria bacterium]|nr:hypothetical protein [Candidatus Paceibacterota bacterium]MDR3583661.1 hypothetical protein [Candidatus Paceibacterota bacterium]
MASQIAHIVYARKYFDRLEIAGKDEKNIPPENLDRDEFLLGCVFPDIRRIDPEVRRRDTHLRFDPLDLDFSKLTSFESGWKFHLWCDMRREEILNKHEFYSLKHTTDFYNQPAKILEDELVYDKYNNWEKIVNFFNNPPYIDAGVGVSSETFHLWYAVVAKYAERKPDDKSMRIFLSKQPKIIAIVNGLMESVEALRKNKKAIVILDNVLEEII